MKTLYKGRTLPLRGRAPEHGAVVLTELTVNHLLESGRSDRDAAPADFLDRIETLAALDYPVLISNYPEYYRLVTYFRRYTEEPIGIAMGVNNLLEIHNGYIESIPCGDAELTHIYSRAILEKIHEGDDSWTDSVPEAVAKLIRANGYFGWSPKG